MAEATTVCRCYDPSLQAERPNAFVMLAGETRWGRGRFSHVTAMESNGANSYAQVANIGQMRAEEQTHGRVLSRISRTMRGGLEGSALAQVEGRHRGTGGNALRAAVLGANDGLTSVLSLVMGVAGAGLPSHTILLTGLAGLLAGAISMALGEWLSVQSSRELFTKQIAVEQAEIESSPQEEVEELSLIYQSRGIGESEATMLATEIMSNKDTALDTLAREELGINPDELGGPHGRQQLRLSCYSPLVR